MSSSFSNSKLPRPASSSSLENHSRAPSVDHHLHNGFPLDFPHPPSASSSLPLSAPRQSSSIDHDHLPPPPTPGLADHRPSSDSRLMLRGTTVRHSFPSASAPARPAQRPSEPRPRPHAESEPRKCWICYDDDEPGRSESAGRKRWVKACRCSLVAHESCLLTWVTTYQLTHAPPASVGSPLATPVRCPQCAAPYGLVQPAYPLLGLLHRLKRPYDSALSWSALAAVLLGLGVSASSYGLWASRCFLGPVRWARLAGHELGLVRLFQLSLVGPVLVLSRTSQLDPVLPFLPLSLLLSSLPPRAADAQALAFPPEPALTLCLLPWARVGWGWLWHRLAAAVLRREYRALEHMGLAYEPAPGLPRPIDELAPRDRPDDPPGQAAEFVLDYSTLRGAVRSGMEALLWPGAASLAGSLLFFLSRRRPWLRTLLGIRALPLNHRHIWTLSTIGQFVHKLIGDSTYFFNGIHHSDDHWIHNDDYDDDPVWWRNCIGGSILVVVRDVVCLVEKCLKVRKLGKRRIVEVNNGQAEAIGGGGATSDN